MRRRSVSLSARIVGRLVDSIDSVKVDGASTQWGVGVRKLSRSAVQPLHTESLNFASSAVSRLSRRDADAADVERDTTVVLHGLLGNGRNLKTFVNTLFTRMIQEQERRKSDVLVEHRVVLMDLRHHGHTHAKGEYIPTTPDTLENCARDVFQTLRAYEEGENVGGQVRQSDDKPLRIIGHSLGGKVALAAGQLATDDQDIKQTLHRPSCQIWTLDSFPFSFDETHSRNALGVLKILETIEGIVQPLESREELYEILDSFGFQKNLKDWLGSNLVGNPEDGYVWNFHLPGAFNLYRDYSKTDFTEVLGQKSDHSFGIVRALLSRGWDEASVQQLERLAKASREQGHSTHVYELDKAGHWLHAQNPHGLVDLMVGSRRLIHE